MGTRYVNRAYAPVYIFAGGGTGGHLVPALAVAEALLAVQPGAGVVFACSDRPIDRRILSATPFPFVPQPIRPLPRSLLGWGGFLKGLRGSRLVARDLLRDLRPAAVFGLGGFAAAVATRAAARAGIRTGLMSIDAMPGVANRHLARYVDRIFSHYRRSQGEYGRWGGKVELVGFPVRRSLLAADAAQARRFFGLRQDRQTLLVMSGSLGAANINQAVAALGADLDELAGQWQLMHVAGPGKTDQAIGGGGEAPHARGPLHGVWRPRIHRSILEFCDRMDLAYAAADLVLCRAGAATVGELAAVGKPAVLVPYPYHRDQHQRANAAEMVEAGAAEVVTDACDPAENAEALRRSLIAVMRDPQRLAKMAGAATGAGGPQSRYFGFGDPARTDAATGEAPMDIGAPARVRTDAAEKIARWLVG